jgi:hypothetical protein
MTRRAFYKSSQPIVDGVIAAFEEDGPPLTVRRIYYVLSTKYGLVVFSERGYDQVQRLTLRMRRLGVVPWGWFADRTRRVDVTPTWNGLDEFRENLNDCYRRDLWEAQAERVEIWLEKDAAAGFFKAALGPYRVGLYTIRGFSSRTFIYEAAEAIKRQTKPTHVYYFGDHDPSGLAIEEDVAKELGAFGANLASFRRVGVTLDDVDAFGLRTLKVKRSDSRAKRYLQRFGDVTVELDALPTRELRRRIVECVDRHIDSAEWERLLRVEEIERETIATVTAGFVGGAE